MVRTALVLTLLVLWLAAPGGAMAADRSSPEGAVREYLAGVAAGDTARIIEASAVDEMADGYRFELMIDRIKALGPTTPGPIDDTLLRELEADVWRGEQLRAVRFLVYSLLAPDLLGEALELRMVPDVDARWARELTDALDTSRLSGIEVLRVELPAPELFATEGKAVVDARNAAMFGANEQTERVALIRFEDALYALGLTLLRYGDEWSVQRQVSAVSGLPGFIAQPTTIDEFEGLIPD